MNPRGEEFRWSRVVFGFWGLLNTLAAVAFLAAVLRGELGPAEAKTAWGVLFVLAFVPLGQVAFECARLGLNADEHDGPDVHRRALRGWKMVFCRTPIASSFMLLVFLAAVVMLALGGGTLVIDGETTRGEVGMAVILVFFCYLPVYMNAFVLHKCGDLARR